MTDVDQKELLKAIIQDKKIVKASVTRIKTFVSTFTAEGDPHQLRA